jgi:3-mercaptopyruvate sulfurtransferase SseA
MSKTKFMLAFSLLLLVSLACNALLPTSEPTPTMMVIVEPTFPTQAPPDLPQTEADVPRASLEEALTAYAAGAAIFVDVRSVGEYAASHILGAINIPVEEIELNPTLAGIDKDEWIITYCT